MKIICGTDLTENSRRCVEAAGVLANRFQSELVVAHVMPVSMCDTLAEAVWNMHEEETRERVALLGSQLSLPKDRYRMEVLHGHVDTELERLGGAADVVMMVVGSHGHRDHEQWTLGSCAERVAEGGAAPTLIVRDEAPFLDWGKDGRSLKLFVAMDFSSESENALRWISRLLDAGPCEVTVAHVDWPPEELARLGIHADYYESDNKPFLRQQLTHDLKERIKAALKVEPDHVLVEPSFGRADLKLAELVEQCQPDVVVCGTHQRHGMQWLWHGSVSRGLLHHCGCNVLLVPSPRVSGSVIQAIDSVLVATDFSDLANAAIPCAYSLLKGTGKIHLLHVVKPPHLPNPMAGKYYSTEISNEQLDRENVQLRDRLGDLIPTAVETIETEKHVVINDDVATAICQSAERFGADLICLGSHGRSGLSRMVMGSVAQAVIERARKPVVVVKPIRN